MDLLAESRFERFLIVSSDRDFAPLALRLRRSSVPVYGMGASTPGSAWRDACTQFFVLAEVEALCDSRKRGNSVTAAHQESSSCR